MPDGLKGIWDKGECEMTQASGIQWWHSRYVSNRDMLQHVSLMIHDTPILSFIIYQEKVFSARIPILLNEIVIQFMYIYIL